ncbi:serine/threonine-protein kinase [Actinocorallia aurantiaca]|uniref:Protein kinase domain-containing protein n=1 Tax=Actinocorallia aurantiaca TaxID=46204 RepID=A0ABN3U845_9ACTN
MRTERFTLVEELGSGAAGVVWRARDEVLRREVALKRLLRYPGLTPERLAARSERLLREARAAAQLDHPNAVTVFDILRHEDDVFVVMEYVAGRSLQEVVENDGPLSPVRSAHIGMQLIDVLATAHENGIVHRDVKPANILLLPGDRVKLADFGIARLEFDPTITAEGSWIGSPAYMAPEQARGERSGPETDLWALGATLYFMVEGRRAFDGHGPEEIIAAVLRGTVAPPQRAGPALRRVMGRLLTQDRARRPSPLWIRRELETAAETTPTREDDSELRQPGVKPSDASSGRTSTRHIQPVITRADATHDDGMRFPITWWWRTGRYLPRVFAALLLSVPMSTAPAAFRWVLFAATVWWAAKAASGSLRPGLLLVGPDGLAVHDGLLRLRLAWPQIAAMNLVTVRTPPSGTVLMVRTGYVPGLPDPLRGQRLGLSRSVFPWRERRTGWIGVCYLNRLRARPGEVEAAIARFAGPRAPAPPTMAD